MSACILARNNSFGYSVQFSMRGMQSDVDPIQTAPAVPPHDHIFGTNTVVASTLPCPTTTWGAGRDCGWKVASIGMCQPGQPVFVATGQYAKCDPGGLFLGSPGLQNNMLRICKDTHACDAAGAIDSVDDVCAWSPDPGIDFVCPATGYYSVMVAEANSDLPPDGVVGAMPLMDHATCAVAACMDDETCCGGAWGPQCDASCGYPTSEKNVFRWHEGSFYGDLFAAIDPAKPQVRVNPETLKIESWNGSKWIADGGALSQDFVGVVYPEMHACASPNWVEDVAYMQYRVCAGPDPKSPGRSKNCAAHYDGRCAQHCLTLNNSGARRDFDAAYCSEYPGAREFAQPMTTFLSGPCDAVPLAAWCTTVPGAPIFPW